MKGSLVGGGGGGGGVDWSFQNNFLKKSWKKSKTKIKNSTRNLKVGSCGFNLYSYDPDYLLKHISSSTLPRFLQIKVHFLNLSLMEN